MTDQEEDLGPPSLAERLRAMSRCEHDDLSIGDEAAARIEELHRMIFEITNRQTASTTLALSLLEQAHQALHLGNERLAMRMIANAMEALA